MISSAGYIDALVLQPRPTISADDLAFISYLERRILHATDEDHKASLLAVLEEFERTRRPLKIVVNVVNTLGV
jgi:hypothetical protein